MWATKALIYVVRCTNVTFYSFKLTEKGNKHRTKAGRRLIYERDKHNYEREKRTGTRMKSVPVEFQRALFTNKCV
jgi:hypothetical protein